MNKILVFLVVLLGVAFGIGNYSSNKIHQSYTEALSGISEEISSLKEKYNKQTEIQVEANFDDKTESWIILNPYQLEIIEKLHPNKIPLRFKIRSKNYWDYYYTGSIFYIKKRKANP